MAQAIVSSIRRLTGNLVETLRQLSEPEPSPSQSQSQRQAVLDDLMQMHRTLRRIHAVLHDAEEREIRDQSVELWLTDLKAVAHEAEDVLDEYHYELQRQDVLAEASSSSGNKRKLKEVPIGCPSFSVPYVTTHVSVSNEIAAHIKRIKNKFQEICEDRQNFSLRKEDGERGYCGCCRRQPSTSLVEEIGVIGREEDREKIIDLLISGSSSFSVIPIVGMGGVGKTTLAQFVYNDVRISQFFNRTAWVCVSDDFDISRLTKEIIESVTRERCDITQPNTLQEILMEKIARRHFFLVLDDVWNKNKELWEQFQVALQSAQFVRILITTRDTFVAEIMQATVPPYQLDSLHDETALILFRNCAFGTQEMTEYSDLIEIGNQIVRKCDGLPLAIKVLGGILRYARDIDSWREILECYTWELDAGREEILAALKLSYYRMPSHLRQCFLYFSMFPKDHEFRRDNVIRMWMAHGYVHAQSNKRLEDIGIKYFKELHGRSLLLSFNKYGEIVYKMHVMIHELAMSLSKRISSGISYGVQHLHLKSSKVLPGFLSLNNPKSLRTLLNYSFNTYSESCFIISAMACLRVLEVEVYGTELPDSIGHLKHLRYLSIIGRSLRRLPGSLCLLFNLQTLDLQHAPFLLELPSGIGNLTNLRYIRLYSEEMYKLPTSICRLPQLQILDLKNCYKLSKLPSGIEQLTSLRSLEVSQTTITHMISGIEKLCNLQCLGAKFLIDRDNNHKGLGEVKDLINLGGTLCISGLENIVDVEHSRQASLISKNYLQKLKLRWRVDDKLENALDREEEGLYLKVGPCSSGDAMNSEVIEEAVLGSLQPHGNIKSIIIHGYNGCRFPKWVNDPAALSKLTEIVLWNCNLGENHLSCLGELPSLRALRAMELCVVLIGENEHSRRCSRGIIFPSLETLELRYMSRWEGFCFVIGDFPCLKKLSVENCPKLLELPTIPSLQVLLVKECQNVKWLHPFQYINEEHPSELHTLVVGDCPGLLPKFELGCFKKLKQLEINDAPFIEISLPIYSELQYIHIGRCRYLCSVHGLGHIDSITDMQLASCPSLEFSNFTLLGSMPQNLNIIDCPKLSEWCQKFQVRYFQKIPPLKELIISNGNIPSASEIYQGLSPEHLCTIPHVVKRPQENDKLISYFFCTAMWDRLPNRDLPRLVMLELNNCNKVVSISGFSHLRFLKSLVISYCSELCNLLGEYPATLQYLLVMECEKLCSIPSLQNLGALEELQIWNCTELRAVVGLQYLTKLETLMVIQCEQIYASPVELCAKLGSVVIRDCPLLKEWCQVNNILYHQWYEMEGEKLWREVQIHVEHLKL